MIDDLAFTKFVFANKTMTEEEKNRFLEAVPKMTDKEKAEYILLVKMGQMADLSKDIGKVEEDALFSGADMEEAVNTFLQAKAKDVDESKIEQIRARLKGQIEASNQASSPEPKE